MESIVLALEDRLRIAMLRSDVFELEALLSDDLIFMGPDGSVITKAQDIDLHYSGVQRFDYIEWHEIEVNCFGVCAVVSVTAQLAGTLRDRPFEGRFRYVRFWASSSTGWRVLGGSVMALSAT